MNGERPDARSPPSSHETRRSKHEPDHTAIRATARADQVAAVEAGIGKVVAALDEANVEGIRYASLKSADGETFLIVIALDGATNPLQDLAAYEEFTGALKTQLAGPPEVMQLTTVGTYRML